MMKRAWQSIVRVLFRALLRVLRVVPWRVAGAWGAAVGALGYHVAVRYRRVANANLRHAYGDALSDRERQALIKRVFQSFGRALMEFLKAPSMSPSQIKKIVKADSYARVEAVLARGKGMILLAAHFGNWELLARRAALEGYEFAVVARQSHDPEFNQITDSLRANGGYTVLPRGGSPRAILQRLRRNGIVAILPDQKSEDVFVPFFGRLAGTVAGPAVLSLKTGAGIIPMFCPRQPDGSYRVEILPEIDTTPSGDTDADIHRIMADITHVIEEMVRRYPDQWLWLHDRWRVPPPAGLDPATGRPAAPDTRYEASSAARGD
ncbi:MAG: lysophospholipid acyltransferase family protein [Armatimonadetes bacterium]|nr:lysophospholipid acyltransferase family protein [Armatimonadota bacterium]